MRSNVMSGREHRKCPGCGEMFRPKRVAAPTQTCASCQTWESLIRDLSVAYKAETGLDQVAGSPEWRAWINKKLAS